MFRRKQAFHKRKSEIFFATGDVKLTSYFRVCKLCALPLKRDLGEMLKHQLVIVLTEPKNMLIRHTFFYCELFSWFFFLAEYEIPNFADVGALRHCMDDYLSTICQTAWYC